MRGIKTHLTFRYPQHISYFSVTILPLWAWKLLLSVVKTEILISQVFHTSVFTLLLYFLDQ